MRARVVVLAALLSAASARAAPAPVLEVTEGPPLRLVPESYVGVRGAAVSPDGRWLAVATERTSGDKTGLAVEVWDLAARKPGARLDRAMAPLTFTEAGKLVAARQLDARLEEDKGEQDPALRAAHQTLAVWDPASGRLERALTMSKPWRRAVVPTRVAAGAGQVLLSNDAYLMRWDGSSPEPEILLPGMFVAESVISPAGVLAADTYMGTIRLHDLRTGHILHALRGHVGYSFHGAASALDFSPDGKLLASGGMDKKVGLWDVATGKLLFFGRGHKDQVLSVAFSSQGLFASLDNSGAIRFWDVAKKREIPTPLATPPEGGGGTLLGFLPDGRTLLQLHGGELKTYQVVRP